jgi:hypothetical protein
VFIQKRDTYDAAAARVRDTEINRYQIVPLRGIKHPNARPKTTSKTIAAPSSTSFSTGSRTNGAMDERGENMLTDQSTSSSSYSTKAVSKKSDSRPLSKSMDYTGSSETKPWKTGTVIASSVERSASLTSSSANEEDIPKWKSKSAAFREAIKLARQVTLAEQKSKETGIPLHELLPASAMNYEKPADYVQCPTCGRSFNENAGARHIPQVTSRPP